MTVYSEIYKIIKEDEYSRMIEDNSYSILEYIHLHMPNELSESEYDYIFSDDIFSELVEFALTEMGLGANAPGKPPSPFIKKTAPKLSTSGREAYRKNYDGEHVTFLKNPTIMHKASGNATPAMKAAIKNTGHKIMNPDPEQTVKHKTNPDGTVTAALYHKGTSTKVKDSDPIIIDRGYI